MKDVYFIRSCKHDIVPDKLYRKSDGLYFWWCDVTMEWVEVSNISFELNQNSDIITDRLIDESELFMEML